MEKIDGETVYCVLRYEKYGGLLNTMAEDAGDPTTGCGGLLFSADTHWKWQWSVVQPTGHEYVHGVSPRFDTIEEAELWMKRIKRYQT